MKQLAFDVWFWWYFNKRSALIAKGIAFFGMVVALVSIMIVIYQQGRESGVVDGMTAGFEVGYKAKKPPVIIVVPPRDGTFVRPKEPGKDSVLWRI